MKTILVTGGCGYIGSHTLLELARQKNYKLIVFDNLVNGDEIIIDIIQKETGEQIMLYKGDLNNIEEINSVFSENDIDAVIHFAALIEAGTSVSQPVTYYKNNVGGTLNLLKIMQNHGVQKIVFSSTAAVYGSPKEMPINEAYPKQSESPYGESKSMVEKILHDLLNDNVEEKRRISSVVLRYFNAAGSDESGLIGRDYPRATNLMTVAIEVALGLRESLTIFGDDYNTPDGSCIRDYVHVSDLATAHIKALEYLFNNDESQILNVGTGEHVSNLEVVKEIEHLHGKYNWNIGDRRPGDIETSIADNSKIKEILDWAPRFSFKDALKHEYEWRKKHLNGYSTTT